MPSASESKPATAEVMTERPAPHTITTNPSTGAKTLELSRPIKLGGVETFELTFRRAFARDLRIVYSKKAVEENGQVGLNLLLAARLSDTSLDELDQLDLADTVKVVEVIDSFQQAGPATSSPT